MEQAFQNILLTITAAGLIGGMAAFLAEPRIDAAGKPQPDPWKVALPRFLFLGLVASACVPLFLSLLQSGIIGKILDPAPTGSDRLHGYLLLAGFCLIAAFSARKFLDTVTAQVLRKAEQAQRDAAEAKARAAGAERRVETVAEVVDEQEAAAVTRQPAGDEEGLESVPGAPSASVGDPERRVLETLAQKTFRTATGIASDTGVGRKHIGDLLHDLAERGLVAPTTSPHTGGKRWQITPAGLAALRAG
jgi:hypothetical protein